ncbi:hypothetical protein [Natrinema pallidum]|uniref:Uncharacterized protein n=1 Tax=Natrinema pallidum DSM 3751 TaxID=1227495 RepID=L9YHB1_9EURY|nr:hypothetical protein [Natrinema pallidum]ELY73484.1 hypothetical protein C487_17045 [Natrinema pallidum DSM 3751]
MTDEPAELSGLPTNEPLAFKDWRWMLPSDRMVIRRYKSFCYFKKVIEDQEFRFGPAIDYQDDDPLEGQATEPVREDERRGSERMAESISLSDGEEIDYAGGMENFRQGSQEQYFLNCWRIGTDEDPRFWEKFTPNGDGVAIETTVGQLKHALMTDLEMYMGLVRYVDQQRHFIPSTPPASYFYKNTPFTIENEFRALLYEGPNQVMDLHGRDWDTPDHSPHHFVEADLNEIINRVIVSPDTDEEFREQVREVLETNGFDIPVDISRLAWDREPGAGHVLHGNDDFDGDKEAIDSQLTEELHATDWFIWDVVDVVEICPPKAPTEIPLPFAHFEVYRYTGTPPDPETYGQGHLNYVTEVHRFEQEGPVELEYD